MYGSKILYNLLTLNAIIIAITKMKAVVRMGFLESTLLVVVLIDVMGNVALVGFVMERMVPVNLVVMREIVV